MTAKVGPVAIQTYRVGVQNRYSAFLEGEEGLALSNSVKRPINVTNNKQKGALNGAPKSSGANKVSGKSESSSSSTNAANRKQDAQAKVPSQVNGSQQGHVKGNDARRQQRDGGKTQQQSNVVGGLQRAQGQAKGQSNRFRNQSNQDGNIADGQARSPRSQTNGGVSHGQQANASQHQQSNENRPFRGANNQRFNRPRAQNGENRKAAGDQQDVQQMNGHLPLSDGEKARHQQRRMNNLKFKDSEKRERRTQVANGAVPQAKPEQTQSDGETISTADQRSPRVRRDNGDKNQDLRNKARPRRVNQNAEPNGERRDGRRDRPARTQRNGFEGGQLAEGGRADKPIPNFSDKADFPSLAS